MHSGFRCRGQRAPLCPGFQSGCSVEEVGDEGSEEAPELQAPLSAIQVRLPLSFLSDAVGLRLLPKGQPELRQTPALDRSTLSGGQEPQPTSEPK